MTYNTITSTSVLYNVWNLFLFEDKSYRNDAYYWILYVCFGFYLYLYTNVYSYSTYEYDLVPACIVLILILY